MYLELIFWIASELLEPQNPQSLTVCHAGGGSAYTWMDPGQGWVVGMDSSRVELDLASSPHRAHPRRTSQAQNRTREVSRPVDMPPYMGPRGGAC